MESVDVVIEQVARSVPMRLPALLARGFWMTNWSPGERWWRLLVLGGLSTTWNDEPLSTSLKVSVVSAWGAAGAAAARAARGAAGAAMATAARAAGMANRWRDMGPPGAFGG